MMKYHLALPYLAVIFFSFWPYIPSCYGQSDYLGTWKGIFMHDFEVEINFYMSEDSLVEGNIRMMAGDNIIQDDVLTEIKTKKAQITFSIPDKNTSYKGNIINKNGITGAFFFPDGSEHALMLIRKKDEASRYEEFLVNKKRKFPKEDLWADLDFLYASLKEKHPVLYTYISKDSLDALADRIKEKINRDLNLEEFFLLSSAFVDAVKCSHTGVRLPISYQNLITEYGNYFPWNIYLNGKDAFYISGNTDAANRISPGYRLSSINEMPIADIICRLLDLVPSEGFNTTTKFNGLNRNFNQLYYLLNDSREFRVKFSKGTSNDSIVIPSVSFKEIPKENLIRTKSNPVNFTYVDNSKIAMLEVKSFAIHDMNRYLIKLDSIFGHLKRSQTLNLVLDLRDNSGGHPIFAAQLLSFLTDHNFVYFKRNEEVEEFEPLYNNMQPNELNFKGTLYVLVNGGCLSTTGHLISLLKFHTHAIFVGEEPGSTFRCNDFSIQLSLPNTGIELNVPRTTFETAVKGFSLYDPFPIDYELKLSADEITKRKDTYLEQVKAIVYQEN
jgi:hypothetical protein